MRLGDFNVPSLKRQFHLLLPEFRQQPFVYWAACGTLIGIILYLLYIRFRLIFSYSLDLDGAEFFFVNFVQLLEQGKSLYRNPLEFPFMGVQHAPAYPYLLYFIGKCLRFNLLEDIHQMLTVARLVAWLSMFVNIYVVVKILRRFGLSTLYFISGLTLYLLLITGHFYATRPDGIKTTLFTIFLYYAFEYVFYKGGKKQLVFSILAATLVILFKHDSVINIYICLVLLSLYLQNKRAYYLLTFFTLSLVISGVSCYLIFGKYFFTNTILFNVQVITDVANSINIWIVLFSVARNFPLLLLAFYGSLLAIKNFSKKEVKYFIPLLSFIYFGIVHVLMLRPGSYLNYTFELILLLVLNAVLFAKQHEDYILKHLKGWCVLAFTYFLFIVLTNRIIHSYTFDSTVEAANKRAYLSALAESKQILSITGSEIVFLPNFKYVVFFANAPYIWGYEMHFDRVLEVFLNFKIKSKLLFIPTQNYDACFTNGKVKFIIVENDKLNIDRLAKYYPSYSFYQSFSKFRVYKFNHDRTTEG
jgi:hypothetical protein